MEKLGGKCKKLKNLVESGKIGKSLKSGKICFGKFVKSLENLSKNEKILKRQKMKNWKILEKPGGKWQNMKTLLESGKIWKTWWKVGKFGKSLKSGKILNLWNFGKSVKKWKNIEKAKNRQLENSGKTCWKVEKCVKPGGKWKNFVKVWKWEKFVKRENLLKNEKYWNGKKGNTGKLCKSWWKVGKSEKPGGKWKNFVKVWKVENLLKCVKLLKIYQKMKKYWNGKKGKTGKFWKNLFENDKICKTWWKMEKCEKLGRKWKNVKNLV